MVEFHHTCDALRAWRALNGKRLFVSSGVTVIIDFPSSIKNPYTATLDRSGVVGPRSGEAATNGYSEYSKPRNEGHASEHHAYEHLSWSPNDGKPAYTERRFPPLRPYGRPPTHSFRSQNISPPPLRRYETYRPQLRMEARQALRYDSYRPDDRSTRDRKSEGYNTGEYYQGLRSHRSSDALRPTTPVRVYNNQHNQTRHTNEAAQVQSEEDVYQDSPALRHGRNGYEKSGDSAVQVLERSPRPLPKEATRDGGFDLESSFRSVRKQQVQISEASPHPQVVQSNGAEEITVVPNIFVSPEESTEEGEYSPRLSESLSMTEGKGASDRTRQFFSLSQDPDLTTTSVLALTSTTRPTTGAGSAESHRPGSTSGRLLRPHPGFSDETASVRSEITTSDKTGTSTNSASTKKRHCKECKRAAHLFPLQKCNGCQRRFCDFCRTVCL